VVGVEGGFSLPELKWRELLFVGALRPEGDAFVRDPARPCRPSAARASSPRVALPGRAGGAGRPPPRSIIPAMEASPGNVAPRILSRPEHNLSRKNIDPDALKVLYRLKNNGFVAYLVGGGVRDLLLERQPKDFDIGTSAHPQQVRKLFRNCFIVGRRFRLAHVRFGRKVVEVSTFRRAAEPEEGDTLIRRDNTFGTPEEDAFRRDFTVNALFYDIATFSVIDWVRGIEDLIDRVIRTIGDPGVRFREDPVRMLRAVALAARLGFTIDPTPRRRCGPCAARSCAAAPPASWRSSTRSCARAARAAPSRCSTSTACSPTSCPRPTTRSPRGAGPSSPRSPGSTPTGRRASPPPTSSPTPCSWARSSCRSASRCGAWPPPRPPARRAEPGPDAGPRATTWPPRSRSWGEARTRTTPAPGPAAADAPALRPARHRAPAPRGARPAAAPRGPGPGRPSRDGREEPTSTRPCAGSPSTARRRGAPSPASWQAGRAGPGRGDDEEPSAGRAASTGYFARRARRRRRRRRRRRPRRPPRRRGA
jgi:hypothetical protein